MGSELFSSLGDVTVTTLQGTHDQRLKLLNQQLGPNRLDRKVGKLPKLESRLAKT